MQGQDDPFNLLGTQLRDQEQQRTFARLQERAHRERKPTDWRLLFALVRMVKLLQTNSPTSFYLFVLPLWLFLAAILAFAIGHRISLQNAHAVISQRAITAYVLGGVCLAGMLFSMMTASHRALGLNRIVGSLHLIVAVPFVGLVCHHYLNPAHSALRHIPSGMTRYAVLTMISLFVVTLAHDLIRGQRYQPRDME